MDDPEAALLLAAGRGDGGAFRRLVEPTLDRLYSVAYRLLGHAQDAEDAVQDSLVKAWAEIARFRPGEARYATFLHRVVVNRCLDRLRAGKLRRHGDLEEAETVADPGPSPAEQAAEREEAIRLRRAIDALPERQRVALTLVHAGGLKGAEVAAVMGISAGAVESLLVRAKRDLRAKLGDEEDPRR